MSSDGRSRPDRAPLDTAPLRLAVSFADAMRKTALPQSFERDPGVHETLPIATVSGMLYGDADLRVLILYETPASYVAQRIVENATPEAALEEWQQAARQITACLALHRDRISLVSLDMAAQYSGVLAARLGLDRKTALALEDIAQPALDPLLDILVAHAMRQTVGLHVLAGEIEASAINLSNRDTAASPDQDSRAFARYLAQRDELEELRAELRSQNLYAEETFFSFEEVQARLADMTAARDAQQKELEDSRQDRTALQEKLDSLKQDSAAALELTQERHDALELTQAQTVQKARDLQAALSVMQDRLMQSQADQTELIRKAASEKEALHRKLTEAETWLHGIQASRSYRIMAPLRRLRAAMKRGG